MTRKGTRGKHKRDRTPRRTSEKRRRRVREGIIINEREERKKIQRKIRHQRQTMYFTIEKVFFHLVLTLL